MSAPTPDQSLIDDVRRELGEAANPEKAEPMRAYMKSAMPFHGVQSPGVARICRQVFAAHSLADRAVWDATVRALWDGAAYREERYAAIALTGHRSYRDWQDRETLPLYDHLTVTGAWWDYVDEVASKRVGPILRADPDQVTPVLRRWANDDDIWRRRVAILAQLGSKAATDPQLLEACLAPSLTRPEFFLRKAIGWALREYARTDPDWVRRYVDAHEHQLSPLSRREALKHLR
ncbi:DNA alkylation repair protein [Actinopolymorpha alba]|uniref:DNA alkylation repair protein n=1 Tax=Actinopolymorpha alba TaxID=533267 RepID=UPI00036D5F58|nr:DNA alkylation repair protein [Actinopolymorpha alba]